MNKVCQDEEIAVKGSTNSRIQTNFSIEIRQIYYSTYKISSRQNEFPSWPLLFKNSKIADKKPTTTYTLKKII